MDVSELERVKHEYDKNLDVHKHWATLQFAQLSAFIAITSGALLLLFRDNGPGMPFLLIGKIGVAIVSGCLWVVQESQMYVVAHCLRRYGKLEEKLGYQIFSTMPGMPGYKWAPARWALRIIYAFVFFFWTGAALLQIVDRSNQANVWLLW